MKVIRKNTYNVSRIIIRNTADFPSEIRDNGKTFKVLIKKAIKNNKNFKKENKKQK